MNDAADAGRLVILGSGITALAVARCARRLGLEPVVFDAAAEVAASSRLVLAEIHPQPWCDSILSRLQELGSQRKSLLICTADAWLQFLILHRAQLEAAYVRILHPANDVLALCLDKGRFADWCRANGLPVPRTFVPDTAPIAGESRLPFPVMVRPAETLHSTADAGAIKAVEVRTRAQLEEQLKQLTRANRQPVLSESLLERRLVQHSVGLARSGEQLIAVVARKLRPPPRACGPGTLVETAGHLAVEALGRQVATLLDYQGIGEVEILEDLDTSELFLIEVNPRPWLQFALGAATGKDLLGLVARDQPQCTPRQAVARWLDLRGDLRLAFRSPDGLVRSGQIGLWNYLRSLASANVFARWSALDQAPFWREMLEMGRILRPRESRSAVRANAPGRRRSWRQPRAAWRGWTGPE